MAKCLEKDCNREALEESAYCARHQPRIAGEAGCCEKGIYIASNDGRANAKNPEHSPHP
jgi:hypothetical protein